MRHPKHFFLSLPVMVPILELVISFDIFFLSYFKCCIKQIEVSTEMLTPIRFRRISAFSRSQLCNKGGKEFFVVGYYAIVGVVENGRILGLVNCHDAL